jgi:acetoacetyl-CoA synthetase
MTGTTLSTVEALTPLWLRVLPRSRPQQALKPDENFFDLGGDAAAAKALFKEVAQIFHREFAPATICFAPTLATLAALLENPAPPQLAPLVLLNTPPPAGFEGPPIFMAHGIGSSVVDLVHLARSIQTRQPIYGMQLRGTDGLEPPFDRVENMAAWFLDALHDMQPSGPYFLVGYSFGGLIALEMAQRLQKQGQDVARLVMIDSYPHRRRLPAGPRILLTLRLAYLRFRRMFRPAAQHPPAEAEPLTPLLTASELARKRTYVALRFYRPRPYRGTIYFVRPMIPTHFPPSPIPVWARLASHISVDTMPGTHLAMNRANTDLLASHLSRILEIRSADRRPEASHSGKS